MHTNITNKITINIVKESHETFSLEINVSLRYKSMHFKIKINNNIR